jgi:hypothetical protein
LPAGATLPRCFAGRAASLAGQSRLQLPLRRRLLRIHRAADFLLHRLTLEKPATMAAAALAKSPVTPPIAARPRARRR